jgi:hypothetical protein
VSRGQVIFFSLYAYILCHLAFIPKLKNANRRIQFLQHLRNVISPNIFGKPPIYLFFMNSNLYLSLQFSVHMNSNVQVLLESKGSYQIWFMQTSNMPIQPMYVKSAIAYYHQAPQCPTCPLWCWWHHDKIIEIHVILLVYIDLK